MRSRGAAAKTTVVARVVAIATATTLTVLLAMSAVRGGLYGWVTYAVPTEPCPHESIDHFRLSMLARFLLSALMVMTAFVSIPVAWWGLRPGARSWPWLAASALGLVLSAVLVIPIDWVSSC